ncbi:MAG TPA: PilZ domain-containing protein [Terriglobales bacterium]|nr:PilZ domain-containing protein [Terriglobales bacterium]
MDKSARFAGPSAAVTDVRTGTRFPLQLPITISETQSRRRYRATTDNVSAAGVFFRAAEPLKVGTRISFDIMLPGQVLGAQRDVKIRCAGRVVRAESSRIPGTKPAATREELRGMACVIDQYRFIPDATE